MSRVLPSYQRHDPCVSCGGPVERRLRERDSNYGLRKTCSCLCEHEERSKSAREMADRAMAAAAEAALLAWPNRAHSDTQAGLEGDCFAPHTLTLKPQPGRLDRPATVLPRQD